MNENNLILNLGDFELDNIFMSMRNFREDFHDYAIGLFVNSHANCLGKFENIEIIRKVFNPYYYSSSKKLFDRKTFNSEVAVFFLFLILPMTRKIFC